MAYAEYQAQAARQFVERLRQFETGMLITHGSNGHLHGRPMAVAEIEPVESERFSCYLWFLTGLETSKADEIRQNQQVLVTFQDRQKPFLTLSGRAHIVQDAERVDAFWRENYRRWLPQGKGDPNLALIRVRLDDGQVWEQSGALPESVSF
ncbi:pyridoxamine 5'-phosphate oxidase family protein [Vampirovibrio chlorellavorus]|uniref:pyridoxamine 5'-phosphate oxidase family protein n=1 Tax=Vampirovibrio chlorellavorus TaxID=758823 RepID=UPI0026ED8334|nr:pyridoxamine 5'-phosphate oxidase family protein [Vampirovibrio chlorellavorus]